MLNMLEDIHNTFKSRDDLVKFLDLLLDEDNCPLYFNYLDIGEYHLEDSIYIKMNARGKPLSDFEKFKASFEKIISKHDEFDYFADSIDANAVHGSDSAENAAIEIKYFFG